MPAANGSWRSWVNPRPDRADPESVRVALLSLEKFLRNPTFASGIGLGSGSGNPVYDPTTGTTAPPTTTPFNQDTVDEIVAALPPDDGAAPGMVTGLSLTPGINSIFARWTESSDADVMDGWGQYRVQLATVNTFASVLVNRVVGGNFTAFTGLTTGVTHYVRVRAIDAYGNESTNWSSVVSSAPIQITGPDIAANQITANHIVANTITAAEIAADAITASELASVAMTNSKYMESDSWDGTTVEAGDATTGWRIQGNGNVEFNSGRFRGDIFVSTLTTTGGGGGYVEMDNSGLGEIFFRYPGDSTPAYIYPPAANDLVINAIGGDLDIVGGTSLDIDCDSGSVNVTSSNDVNITAGGDDVVIQAADDIILDPSGRTEIQGSDFSMNATRWYYGGLQQPKLAVGNFTGSTDGSSDVTVSHSLGTTPTGVVFSPNDTLEIGTPHTFGGSSFKVRFTSSATGGVVGSGVSVGGYWIAWAIP